MNEETKASHAFTKELCKGNKAAEEFCNLWFIYCHGIDDLLDTAEDGRPTMKPEVVLELFATAALVYNHPFFVAHRAMLFPVALMVTNLYADSVAWEKSPHAPLRTIADVLRCCGDEMLLAVGLILGGWSHMRSLSGRIRATDWRLQHDDAGNPK